MHLIQFLIAMTLIIAACGNATPPTDSGLPASPLPAATATLPPTPTTPPLAATVNGQPILLSDYENEVARFEAGAASLGRDLSQEGDYRARVLEALIDKALILQAAASAGLAASDTDAQAAYDQAVAARGGQEAFDAWLAANLYTADQFRAELRDSILISAVQSQVVATVPLEAVQVHARQILLATPEDADRALADLAAGADFATLAVQRSLDQSSKVNGGDLGWFPKGGLTVPEVADAAFALEPGQTGGAIKSALGYHIVQTLERGAHPLSPTSLSLLRRQAVDSWRAGLRADAVIEKFLP